MQKAAALDPEDRAALPGDEGEAARETRLEGAYQYALNIIRWLCDPGKADTGGPAEVLKSVQLSLGERLQYLDNFLQVRRRLCVLPSVFTAKFGSQWYVGARLACSCRLHD